MAFTVTPTSGSAPYLFEAEILNSVAIDLGVYSAHFYGATQAGSCPAPPTSGTDQPVAAQALVAVGSYEQIANSVPAGSCRVHNLVIREISTGTIVDSSIVTIDNV